MDADEGRHALLNIKQLSYFVALAEHGSISAAANVLNMAQPSMSENIAKLEKQLDTQLAIRGSRGIQLTEAGSVLARRGAEILQSIDALVEEIRHLSGEPRGPVRIGITPSLSILLAVPLLETIHAEFPEIRMSFSEGMSNDVLDWVASDRVDIGCVYEAHDSATFAIEPLLTEDLFLVTAPDNWPGEIGPDGVAIDPIPAARLAEFPLVLTGAANGARKFQERFARSIGIQLNVIASIDSLAHIVEMVSRASAYTIVSHGAVVNKVAEGKLALVRIKDPGMNRKAFLVRKRARPVSRVCSVVEERIKRIVGEMIQRYRISSAHVEDAGVQVMTATRPPVTGAPAPVEISR
ncbi:MAG: LysR family transcriptional regulator [Methylobacteriaceae bacterium]|nr:LysR family transcriptional regulator [Methylobacteriaceae bacterium]